MPDINSLEEAIKIAAESWPSISNGDPNTADVHWHATKVAEYLNLQLPTELPEKEMGVKVVILVNDNFIRNEKDIPIRDYTPQDLVDKGKYLVDCIQKMKLLSFRASEIYVVSLHMWHGCICMAKCVRKTFVVEKGREVPYTHDLRLNGYGIIQSYLQYEENKGSPWVRYGVSLARLFEKGEKVDDWVPRDSPYWD